MTVKFLTGFGQRPPLVYCSACVFGLWLSFLAGMLGMFLSGGIWVIRLWNPDEFDPRGNRGRFSRIQRGRVLMARRC